MRDLDLLSGNAELSIMRPILGPRLTTNPYPCLDEKCKERFADLDNAVEHITTTHSMDLEYFICPNCKKGFRTAKYLAGHIACHSDEKPYIYTDCGIGFPVKQYL
ncbi:hypothetical protein LTR56_011526 [Elasticomyces elasticus]|nr:hypothetical protein LTR56_011526 [Elasticomyces elasticus]KAK3643255.1 hypothetical protein LTR22_015722 [Elasticomyces elasticus]KAK4930245.1 hypothetical protein LTR49_003279 [Elasticomyces elasticus]KAK5761409.1 hypothetical protein LTS12_008513 [Elasticomyces elasticus]